MKNFKVSDMKLIGERVLVAPEYKKPKLVVPDSAIPTPRKGLVIKSSIDEIKPDDTVYFKRYEWMEIGDKENKFFLIEKDNIIAIET